MFAAQHFSRGHLIYSCFIPFSGPCVIPLQFDMPLKGPFFVVPLTGVFPLQDAEEGSEAKAGQNGRQLLSQLLLRCLMDAVVVSL